MSYFFVQFKILKPYIFAEFKENHLFIYLKRALSQEVWPKFAKLTIEAAYLNF